MEKFAQAFRLHRWLLAFAAIYGLIMVELAILLGASWTDFSEIFAFFVPAAATTFFFPPLMLLFWLLAAAKEAPRTRAWPMQTLKIFEDKMARYWNDGRLHNALVTILALFPVTAFFCIGKSMIPLLTHYNFDPALAETDRLLHFGHYPHEYIVPLVERLNLAETLDNAYLAWFMVIYMVTEFANWGDPDQHRRQRFLWSYCFCWVVIGNIAALLLASVGPIYLHDFYPDMTDPYTGLIAHLKAQGDLKMFALADALLGMVHDSSPININAISAAPSLHIAMCALTFLYFRSINKAACAFLFFFFLVMVVGSIYLGWHYAIDGYLGTLMAWGLWRLSNPLVRRLERT